VHYATFDNVAEQEGFRKIGELTSRLRIQLWWHAESKIQLLVMPLGDTFLIKGSKSYYLQSISKEGATWARDIGPLHDYLEAHFPDLHISFSFFRDVSSSLAMEHVRRRQRANAPTRPFPTADDLARLQGSIQASKQKLKSMESFQSLSESEADLLGTHIRQQSSSLRKELQAQEESLSHEREMISLFKNLQRRYKEDGSAACYRFTVASHLHTVDSPSRFQDGIRAIVKELADLHRYQINQKLAGGRLNIQVQEVEEPSVAWIEEALSASLSPMELERLDSRFAQLKTAAEEHLLITPDVDIQVDANTKDQRKLLGARVVSTFVNRLDQPESGKQLDKLAAKGLAARIGDVLRNGQSTNKPCEIPIDRFNHVYVSGKTGSGKSYAGRILIEEASKHNLNILCLDPRNQAAGLLVPEDRDSILGLYPDFRMKASEAKGFGFSYFSPALLPKGMPKDLAALATGRNVLSFKGLDDRERCLLFSRVLDAVFQAQGGEESDSVRFLLVIEEAQRFTKKKVSPEAKSAAERAERALDRTVREGRKYGCCVVIISQTIRDFAYDSASIRQNTNTKIFLNNSDREVDYAATYLEDGKQITHLEPGTAVIFNPVWGEVTARIRPPFSKVWEFSNEATIGLTEHCRSGKEIVLSQGAAEVLGFINAHFKRVGVGVNLTWLAEEMGISSKRKLHQIIGELEAKGAVRTRKLRERGQPRIVELISSKWADETRTESGRNGLNSSEEN